DLVVLDEVTYLPFYDFLDVGEIVELLHQRPPRLHMILTGRNAHRSLIDVADTVTEMDVVKHAYEKGIKAQKGIEF
ncbi:MAG TPA: cob(I)yrinic acid a,c-diamide adenosyltransferase, partial [Desulfopila sp.]|nr:cob(I)yrinic acid a,c-diamide adenosyltransferase [Desulfopila sp.]